MLRWFFILSVDKYASAVHCLDANLSRENVYDPTLISRLKNLLDLKTYFKLNLIKDLTFKT